MPVIKISELNRPVWNLLMFVSLWTYASFTSAMDLEQMRAIPGVQMIESRANEVIQAYGQATKILPTKTETRKEKTKLPSGDWSLIYTPKPGKPNNKNKNKQQAGNFFKIEDFSSLVLHAKGGVGLVVVRRKPQKTTYGVPEDPYQAHQVISVTAELRQPMAMNELTKYFGEKFEEIQAADNKRWIRYWVMHREGIMPLRLYAVEFGIDASTKKVTSIVANGPQVEFVNQALVSSYKIWERNMND